MNRTRPPAVREITKIMVLETCFFGGVGIVIFVLGFFESQQYASSLLCGGLVFLSIGVNDKLKQSHLSIGAITEKRAT
jgi:hypothetical protein